MTDPPDPKYDVDWMLNSVDWVNVLEANKEITIHFYLPDNTFKINREYLITDFLSSIKNRRWNVYINTDSKVNPKKMGKSSNNYTFNSYLD